MSFFKIRSRRISVEFTVRIYLQQRKTGKLSGGYLLGTMVNISRGGACVIMEKIILDGDHLFFTTQVQSGNYLYLSGAEEHTSAFEVIGTADWMDSTTFNGKRHFKIGLKFIEDQKNLFKYCKKKLFRADNT